jgi:hypothetical protein
VGARRQSRSTRIPKLYNPDVFCRIDEFHFASAPPCRSHPSSGRCCASSWPVAAHLRQRLFVGQSFSGHRRRRTHTCLASTPMMSVCFFSVKIIACHASPCMHAHAHIVHRAPLPQVDAPCLHSPRLYTPVRNIALIDYVDAFNLTQCLLIAHPCSCSTVVAFTHAVA